MHPTVTFRHALALALALGAANPVRGQGGPDYERPPIAYSAATPADAVAALRQRITSGDFAWPGGERALLAAVLRELQVPVASPVAVFSCTRLQRDRIRPARRRRSSVRQPSVRHGGKARASPQRAWVFAQLAAALADGERGGRYAHLPA